MNSIHILRLVKLDKNSQCETNGQVSRTKTKVVICSWTDLCINFVLLRGDNFVYASIDEQDHCGRDWLFTDKKKDTK